MFRPNRTATWRRRTGRDKHSREIFAEPVTIPCAVIRLRNTVGRTTVRADSSASRGAAEEFQYDVRILVPARVTLSTDDLVIVNGEDYRVIMSEPRYSVLGHHDHNEVFLGASPQ